MASAAPRNDLSGKANRLFSLGQMRFGDAKVALFQSINDVSDDNGHIANVRDKPLDFQGIGACGGETGARAEILAFRASRLDWRLPASA